MRPGWLGRCGAISLALLLLASAGRAEQPRYQHGISLLHDLKYPADFTHFDYANPSAPKGGSLTLSTTWPVRNFSGAWGTGVANASGLERTIDRLLVRSADEQSGLYGLLVDGIALSDDGKSLFIRLHAGARWHDGVPVTTGDVRFSYAAMDATSLAGSIYLRSWIERIDMVNARELVIHHRDVFTHANLLALTTFPLRPAHYYADRDPRKPTLVPPIGSGPYRVAAFDSNHVVYERVDDYWARDHPVNRGRHNFDAIRYDVYRDATVAREAFRKGLLDVFWESDVRYWHASYDIPALEAGRLLKDTRRVSRYIGQERALAFNLERENDARLRLLENVTAVKFKRQRRFDMYFRGHDFLNPPMGQLHTYFGSESADLEMGGNLAAIRDPVVDALIERAQRAPDMKTAAIACRALDRVLLWGFYHIPLNMPDEERFLYWDRFGRADESSAIYEYLEGGLARVIDSWWVDEVKSDSLPADRRD